MLRFAFRNVFRNKLRTSITLVLIVLFTFLITFVRFFAYGVHQETLWNAVGLSSGFIQVAANGWLENKPVERALEVAPEMLNALKVEGVTVVSPRIEGYALASHAGQSMFVSVVAADPRLEKQITTHHTYPIRGKFLHDIIEEKEKRSADVYVYNVILGKTLANNLDADLGGELSLVTSQFDGSVGAILCRVVGIYKTMDPTLDNDRVFLPLSGGEDLYGLGTQSNGKRKYTSIVIGVKDYLLAEKVYRELQEKYPRPVLKPGEAAEDSANYDPVVHFWPELIPALVQLMDFDDIQNNSTWAFLLIIVAFGVLMTVQMSIQDRMREFGILMAIGTRQIELLKMVFYETVIILLPGLLLGSLCGIALGAYFEANPIQLSGEMKEAYESLGMQLIQMRSIVDLRELWIGLASLFFPSIILALFAARRIFKINPVRVINTN